MIHVPANYVRFCGWLLMIGGAMGVAVQVVHAPDVPASIEEIHHFLSMAVNVHVLLAYASTFVLMGLSGIFLRQASGLKLWGWLSFPLLFIGIMLEIFHGPVQILAYPILFGSVDTPAQLQAVSSQINNFNIDQFPGQLAVLIPIMPCMFIGMILLSIATLKARILPKGPAFALLFALFCSVAYFIVPIHFFGLSFSYVYLAFAWFGVSLAFENTARSSSPFENAPI
jgi:hypothetical protein